MLFRSVDSRNIIPQDKKSASVIDPNNTDKPLDPTNDLNPQIDQIFQKKNTPSPDEIRSAIQYELSQMVKKDKYIAKQTILKNLKTDPQYYSRLQNLNISDKDMKVDETTFEKTKKVIDDMVTEKYETISKIPNLDSIFENLRKKRYNH